MTEEIIVCRQEVFEALKNKYAKIIDYPELGSVWGLDVYVDDEYCKQKSNKVTWVITNREEYEKWQGKQHIRSFTV